MARSKSSSNGKLEEAMALLIQNQASFLGRISEMDRVNSERFARIEATLAEHSRILAEHSRILIDLVHKVQALSDQLPDAVADRLGFRMPEKPKPEP